MEPNPGTKRQSSPKQAGFRPYTSKLAFPWLRDCLPVPFCPAHLLHGRRVRFRTRSHRTSGKHRDGVRLLCKSHAPGGKKALLSSCLLGT